MAAPLSAREPHATPLGCSPRVPCRSDGKPLTPRFTLAAQAQEKQSHSCLPHAAAVLSERMHGLQHGTQAKQPATVTRDASDFQSGDVQLARSEQKPIIVARAEQKPRAVVGASHPGDKSSSTFVRRCSSYEPSMGKPVSVERQKSASGPPPPPVRQLSFVPVQRRVSAPELASQQTTVATVEAPLAQSTDVAIPQKNIAALGYEILRELGRGAHSIVSLAKDKNGAVRCLKSIPKSNRNFKLEDFKNEFRIMRDLGQHPRIVCAHEVFQDAMSYYLVQDACEGGDFTTLEKSARRIGVKLEENWWRNVFLQCFQGVEHLHDHAIVHCDLKESNLMLKTSNYHMPEVAIIDFNISQQFGVDRELMIGTPGYMPPEVWTSKKWLPVGDIFCMGVVMMQMVTGNIPEHHRDLEPGEELKGIFAGNCRSVDDVARATKCKEPPFHNVPAHLSSMTSLCRALLDKNWRARPTASQVLEDPWLSSTTAPAPAPASQETVGAGPMRAMTQCASDATMLCRRVVEIGQPTPRDCSSGPSARPVARNPTAKDLALRRHLQHVDIAAVAQAGG